MIWFQVAFRSTCCVCIMRILIQAGVIYYTLTPLNKLHNLVVSKADDCAVTPDPMFPFHLF